MAFDPNDMEKIIQETRKTVAKLHGPKPSPPEDGFSMEGPGFDDYDEFGDDDELQIASEMGYVPTAQEKVENRRAGVPRARVRAPGSTQRGESVAEKVARLRTKRRARFEWNAPYLTINQPETGESVRLKAPEEIGALLEAIEGLGI